MIPVKQQFELLEKAPEVAAQEIILLLRDRYPNPDDAWENRDQLFSYTQKEYAHWCEPVDVYTYATTSPLAPTGYYLVQDTDTSRWCVYDRHTPLDKHYFVSWHDARLEVIQRGKTDYLTNGYRFSPRCRDCRQAPCICPPAPADHQPRPRCPIVNCKVCYAPPKREVLLLSVEEQFQLLESPDLSASSAIINALLPLYGTEEEAWNQRHTLFSFNQQEFEHWCRTTPRFSDFVSTSPATFDGLYVLPDGKAWVLYWQERGTMDEEGRFATLEQAKFHGMREAISYLTNDYAF